MLREAVEQAAWRIDVCDAVARIYAQLQHQIDLRRPKCEMSGRCCRFDEFGHRLYITTMELAAFVASLPEQEHSEEACPFQIGGLCSVHAIRPFGCRVFFCDETATAWQHEQYEHFHSQIKQLHEQLDVPYHYVEWRQALRELGYGLGRKTGVAGTQSPNTLSLPQLEL